MDWWFLGDIGRLAEERKAIADLEASADWLQGVSWGFDGSLLLNAVIKHGDATYEVVVSFPRHYPNVPPSVRPKDADERWSSHQYGDGTLCLEWGPDNWHSGIQAADLLKSAYKLLSIENPLDGTQLHAPSRHQLSRGQEVRSERFRVCADRSLLASLRRLPRQTVGTLNLTWLLGRKKHLTVLVQEARHAGSPVWENSTIPSGLIASEQSGNFEQGIFVNVGEFEQDWDEIKTVESLHAALIRAGIDVPKFSDTNALEASGLPKSVAYVLIIGEKSESTLFWIYNDSAWETPLIESDWSDAQSRLPTSLTELAQRKIGIVGLGSLGSKVALSLARMGASRFYLIDEDILLPENVCRHALDWTYVGQHKVHAVAHAIERIVPKPEIEVSQINLLGQESTATLNGVLKRLGACDILVDATADPRVFNLLCSVVATEKKPIVWGEILGGGIGGVIARSRPNVDPPPQNIRGALLQFGKSDGGRNLTDYEPYAGQDESGQVWIASDSDVSTIASHVASLVADTAIPVEPSRFPSSAYFIGLRREWEFESPFHTIPLSFDDYVSPKKEPVAEEVRAENVKFFMDLLDEKRD